MTRSFGYRAGLALAIGLCAPAASFGQACSFLAYPSPLWVDSTAQTARVYVDATPPTCSWSTGGSTAWATIGPGMTGNGFASVTVSANGTGVERSAALTVAGQTVVLKQWSTQLVFADVTPDYSYFDGVNLLFARKITSGCSTVPMLYCGYFFATRAQIATFIVRAILGGDGFAFSPTPYFNDVPANHPYFPWIQKLRELGVTAGCSPNGYCPDQWITRGEMAVLLIRARYGAADTFSFSTNPRFADVPASHPYFKWIQKMGQDGITAGCSAVDYCPGYLLTRGDAALLLMRAGFNQLLLPGSAAISSVSQPSAAQGVTLSVTVTGLNTNFAQGSTQLSAGAGITISNLVVNSTTNLTATLTIDSAALLGPRSLVATTGSEDAALPNGFQVLPGNLP